MDVETATAEPLTAVSCKITARNHQIIQDKPAEFGGHDKGVMASEHLLAALLSCQLSTFAKVAAKRKSSVAAQSIKGDLHFDGAGDIAKVVLTWDFEGGDEKAYAILTKLTDKVCTISRAMSCPIEVNY